MKKNIISKSTPLQILLQNHGVIVQLSNGKKYFYCPLWFTEEIIGGLTSGIGGLELFSFHELPSELVKVIKEMREHHD